MRQHCRGEPGKLDDDVRLGLVGYAYFVLDADGQPDGRVVFNGLEYRTQ